MSPPTNSSYQQPENQVTGQMDAELLKKNLAACRPVTLAIEGFAFAAVLVPVLVKGGRDHLLFTKRTQTVEHHKGQISFPGGRLDEGESAEQCVLRETHEEIGLPPAQVELWGRLDDIWTPTRYIVTPFVGRIPDAPDLRLNAAEIERMILVPVADLLDPAIYDQTEIHYNGRSAVVPYYHWGEEIIWGATGRIVRQFLALAYPKGAAPCVTS